MTAEALLPRFLHDTIEGLSRPQKTLPSRWLYDEAGSELFDQITRLPEYYLTRIEMEILRQEAATIASAAGPGSTLVEYGAGGSVKTRLLLDALEQPSHYVPVDISAQVVATATEGLRRDYPDLHIRAVLGDFLGPINLPAMNGGGTRVGFFPGSTIGNLSDAEIRAFLKRVRTDLGDGSLLVIGYDLKKDPAILVPAYDDAAGVTAAFNLNILRRIQRELGAELDVDGFVHEARWNGALSRIEMHLVARTDLKIRISDRQFRLKQGESIHTENSRKFETKGMTATAAASGWRASYTKTDDSAYFAVVLLKAA